MLFGIRKRTHEGNLNVVSYTCIYILYIIINRDISKNKILYDLKMKNNCVYIKS